MKVTSRTRSVAPAVKELKNTLHKINKVFDSELEETAQRIYEDAISQVPVLTGKLRDSIEVYVSKGHRKKYILARASAKNERTGYDYAGIQHEVNLKHPNGGKWHYISDPFYKEIDRMNDRIREELPK